MTPPLDVLVFYSPVESTEDVLAAVFAAGAGAIGDYRDCAFVARGTGQFRPLAGANPTIGAVGDLETVAENRVELVLDRHAASRRRRRAPGRPPLRGAGLPRPRDRRPRPGLTPPDRPPDLRDVRRGAVVVASGAGSGRCDGAVRPVRRS